MVVSFSLHSDRKLLPRENISTFTTLFLGCFEYTRYTQSSSRMDPETYRVPPGWIQRHTEFLQDGSRDIHSSSRRDLETYRVPPGWIQRHTQFLQEGFRDIQSSSRMDPETYTVPPGGI